MSLATKSEKSLTNRSTATENEIDGDMNEEKEAIEKNVKDLTGKFNPPMCSNCPKRRADRVCINRSCGQEKYKQIICGKCHSEEHSKCQGKVEIDIEEYFVKLAGFLHEQRNKSSEKRQQLTIDKEQLAKVLEDLDELSERVTKLESRITNIVEGYQEPQLLHEKLQENVAKALTLCEHENISNHLKEMKKLILYEKNRFLWQHPGQLYRQMNIAIGTLEEQLVVIKRTIQKSYIGSLSINLNELRVCKSTSILFNRNVEAQRQIEAVNGEFKLIGEMGRIEQYYLNYRLDAEKKYRVRVQFETDPGEMMAIGLMPIECVQNEMVYNGRNSIFCLNFTGRMENKENIQIVRGVDLFGKATQGKVFEMRVDIAGNYFDVSDYPLHENINSNMDKNTFGNFQYVVVIVLQGAQTILLQKFEEISEITL